MFDVLTRRVDALLDARPRVVVAVSGFGGAGKTTLASRLRDHYSLREGQVLRLDSFIVDCGLGPGMLGGFDWERFTAVLADARDGRRLCYAVNDFHGRPVRQVDETPPRVVIVEGVRLLRPELETLFDVSVWIDCPAEVATKRGISRDRADGAGEEHIALWAEHWVPKDREQFVRDRPDLRASLRYAGVDDDDVDG